MSQEPRVAWLHNANDNYYTNDQFQAAIVTEPRMLNAYTRFIQASAYDTLKSDLERCELARDQFYNQAMENGQAANEYRDQCERLEKALEWYADKSNWDFYGTKALEDHGDSAREALANHSQWKKERGEG